MFIQVQNYIYHLPLTSMRGHNSISVAFIRSLLEAWVRLFMFIFQYMVFLLEVLWISVGYIKINN